MGRRVLGGEGVGVVVAVLRELVLLHHVVGVGRRQPDAPEAHHRPAARGAVRRRGRVGQREVGAAGDGHVVNLRLGGGGADVELRVQTGLLLRPHTDAPGAQVGFDENVVDHRRHAEDGGEVRQGLGGAGGDGAGDLQARLDLDLLGREVGLGVGPVEARAEVGGAGEDDVDVEAVGGGLLLREELVHHGGAVPSVLLVGAESQGVQERNVGLGQVFVQLQSNLKRKEINN